MTVTKREALVRAAVGVFCVLAEFLLLFGNGELYIYDGNSQSLLMMAMPVFMGLCVYYPTLRERRESCYRMLSPVRLALGIAALGLIVTLLVLIFTGNSWDAIGYFFVLVYFLIIVLLLLLAVIGFRIRFSAKRRGSGNADGNSDADGNGGADAGL